MRLIDNQQKIIREIIEDRIGRLSRQSTIKIQRVIFYSIYKSGFSNHPNVIFYSFLDPFSFYKHAFRSKFFNSIFFLLFHHGKDIIYIRDILQKLRCWPQGHFIEISLVIITCRISHFDQFQGFFIEM